MSTTLTLPPAQLLALSVMADAADLRRLFPDSAERRVAGAARDALADALEGCTPAALDVELAALADLLGEVHHADAAAAFAVRVRALHAQAEAWCALEAAGRRAAQRGDGVMIERVGALAVPDRVEEPGWCEAVAAVVAAVP